MRKPCPPHTPAPLHLRPFVCLIIDSLPLLPLGRRATRTRTTTTTDSTWGGGWGCTVGLVATVMSGPAKGEAHSRARAQADQSCVGAVAGRSMRGGVSRGVAGAPGWVVQWW